MVNLSKLSLQNNISWCLKSDKEQEYISKIGFCILKLSLKMKKISISHDKDFIFDHDLFFCFYFFYSEDVELEKVLVKSLRVINQKNVFFKKVYKSRSILSGVNLIKLKKMAYG